MRVIRNSLSWHSSFFKSDLPSIWKFLNVIYSKLTLRDLGTSRTKPFNLSTALFGLEGYDVITRLQLLS